MITLNKMINLNKLTLDNKKIFIIILIFLVIIYLDFTVLLKKQFESLKAQGPKITKLKKDLDSLDKDLAKMRDLKNKQQQTGQKPLSKAKKIISEQEVPDVLQDISTSANKNNVNIMQIKPAKEAKAKAKATGKFSVLLITLDLFCDYHSLGKFINDLDNAPIFMAVEDMKISAQTTNYLKQKVNLVLRTYVKN